MIYRFILARQFTRIIPVVRIICTAILYETIMFRREEADHVTRECPMKEELAGQ